MVRGDGLAGVTERAWRDQSIRPITGGLSIQTSIGNGNGKGNGNAFRTVGLGLGLGLGLGRRITPGPT